jgi:hypothetical protein
LARACIAAGASSFGDGEVRNAVSPDRPSDGFFVIPAQAGIQEGRLSLADSIQRLRQVHKSWIPAYAGMTLAEVPPTLTVP